MKNLLVRFWVKKSESYGEPFAICRHGFNVEWPNWVRKDLIPYQMGTTDMPCNNHENHAPGINPNPISTEITNLALNDASVYTAIRIHEQSGLSWTLTLENLVVVLAKQKAELQARLQSAIENSAMPSTKIIKGKE